MGAAALGHARPRAVRAIGAGAGRAAPLTLRLTRARAGDAEAIARLLADAGRALAARGFHNWQPPYPAERVRRDVGEREVWLARDPDAADALVATWTIARAPAQPYDPPPWPEPSLPAAYLNRLAVDPARQGAGVGAWCLAAIDRRAAALGAHAIRCDVLRENVPLRRFYERHGYVAHGERAHSGWRFACYERPFGGAPADGAARSPEVR